MREEFGTLDRAVDVTQCRKILNREADAVEQGDLFVIFAALRLSGDDTTEFRGRVIPVQLLNLTFDPCLFRLFHKDFGA